MKSGRIIPAAGMGVNAGWELVSKLTSPSIHRPAAWATGRRRGLACR
jgi:hypothetical protein